MPGTKKITQQQYNSLIIEDRKLEPEHTVEGQLGGEVKYQYRKATSSNPETQKKLDKIQKMAALFKEAAGDVTPATDADKKYFSAVTARMRGVNTYFFEGKEYDGKAPYWRNSVMADMMKKADDFIKQTSMLSALGSLPLDKNFNIAIGKMDKQAKEDKAEANKRLTVNSGAPEKEAENPVKQVNANV